MAREAGYVGSEPSAMLREPTLASIYHRAVQARENSKVGSPKPPVRAVMLAEMVVEAPTEKLLATLVMPQPRTAG